MMRHTLAPDPITPAWLTTILRASGFLVRGEVRAVTSEQNGAYFANFLCPRNPGQGGAYLLDWQSPVVDIAGYDLANLCATFWTSAPFIPYSSTLRRCR
jgi:hypothetical protein